MGIHIRLVWFILLDDDVEKESHCGSDEQAEECREIFKDTDMVKLIFNLLSLSIRKHFFFQWGNFIEYHNNPKYWER